MTFGPAVGNVGMYVAREMLISVPEDQRQAYLRMVEEISDLKYQLGVEVARQLPRLLAEGDPERVARYLGQVREVAAAGWKSGVEVAKQLPDLYDAPDETARRGLRRHRLPGHRRARPRTPRRPSWPTELDDLERELREMEPKVKRAQELRTQLAARDRRDEKRRKHAVELAAALPPILARLRPRYRPPYLDQVRQVAAADPEASLEAADTLLDLLNGERVSPEGAAEWVSRGLEVLERNKEVGRGYFRLGSKYALQVLEELKEGLALKSVARVLKLYATALSGQEVAIRGTNEMQAVDVYGADHIVLPPEMHFFEDDAQQLHRLQGGHRPRRRAHRVRHLRLLARTTSPRPGRAPAGALPRGVPREHPAPRARPTSPASTRSSPSRRWRGTCSTIVEGHRVDAAHPPRLPGHPPRHGPDPGRQRRAPAPTWPPSPTPRRWSRRSCSTRSALAPDRSGLAAGHPGADRPAPPAMHGRRRGGRGRARSATPPPSPPSSTLLIDEGLADPGARTSPDQRARGRGRARRPTPTGADAAAARPAVRACEDYEQLELPPFMTPVMEELVRPPSDAPVKREAEGAEPQPDGEGQKKEPRPRTSPPRTPTRPCSTTEAPGAARATRTRSPSSRLRSDEEAPAPPRRAADGRSDDAEGGGRTRPSQSGLGEVPQIEPEARGGRPRRAGLPLRRVGPQDRGLPPGLVHAHASTRQTRTQEGFVAATFHEFGGIVTQIRRNFQLMRPEALRKMRYQEDGDDLDTDGLVEYVVDRQARVAPTGRGSTSSATRATATSRPPSWSTCRARPTARSTAASASSTSRRRPSF